MAGKTKFIMLAVALVTFGSAITYNIITAGQESTDDATLETNVVTLAPKVSGYITELTVQDNQQVKKGDVIARIDQTDYLIAEESAEAALASAKAKLGVAEENHKVTEISAPSDLEAAQAQVNSAQATWENAAKTLKRMKSLTDLARSKQQLDDAYAAERNALAALNDAQARLSTANMAPQTIAASEANIEELKAEVKKSEAELKMAQENLKNTEIIAPINGKITDRGVEVGNYVSPGQSLLSIVNDDVWVVANFKETQISNMKVGQKVKVEIDAYPDLDIEGHVDSIQSGTGARFSAFPPQNATGNFIKIVQRVPVKIALEHHDVDSSIALGPGLSVIPTVYTK